MERGNYSQWARIKCLHSLSFKLVVRLRNPPSIPAGGPIIWQSNHFLFSIFLYLFIFSCAGSSLLSKLLSRCGEWRPLSGCGAQASHCGGLLLQSTSSRVCRICNFMLVSAVQQSDSGIYIIYIYLYYIIYIIIYILDYFPL